MLRPRPSDHAPSNSLLLGKLPLALGATAASLTLVGCSYLPESLGGTAGEGNGNSSEEGSGNTGKTGDGGPHDPTDAEDSIRTAVEHIETATEYDVRIAQTHESDDPFRWRGGHHQYTNTPEEIVYTQVSGDGSTNAMYYTNAEHTLSVFGDSFYEEVTEPDAADEFNSDPGVGAASLSQILETSSDLAHAGEEGTDTEYTRHGEDGSVEPVQETVSAHRYSGTFTSTVPEFTPDGALALNEYPGAPFTLWLDVEGVPVKLEHTSGEYTHTHTFVSFDGGLELEMPAPGDPAFP